MSQRKAKQARQSSRAAEPQRPGGGVRGLRRRWLWTAAAVLAAAALIGGILAARGNGPASAVAVPAVAPLQLSGTDPVTGAHVSLASYAGKPVVLNVWGSWCEGCKAEAHDLATFVNGHPGVQTVGIDTQDSSSGARAFYQRYGWHHPSIADPSGSIASTLGLQGTPTTFFLNRKHQVVGRIVGATNLAGFDHGLRVALRD
jgi:thiol-disulfide isomerase/thioredoxin